MLRKISHGLNKLIIIIFDIVYFPGFSLDRLDMGDLSTSAGGLSVNGRGAHEGDIDLMGGGAKFDRLYQKLKVLLLLLILL